MKNKIIVIMLLIVCVTVMCFSLCSSVFAAELDSEAIYNFNQQLLNGNFSDSSYWTAQFVSPVFNVGSCTIPYFNGSTYGIKQFFTVSLNHYYFVSYKAFVNTGTLNFNVSFGSYSSCLSLVNSVESRYTFVVSTNVESVFTENFYIYGDGLVSGQSVTISDIYIIDLTLMFGSGNEPTIDQCQKIFTADYYNYTSGTPLSLSGVNAYQQGVSDTLNSYNVVTLPSVTTSSIFALNLVNVESSVVTGLDDNGVPYALCKGYFGVPFGTLIPKNTTISFNFSLISVVSYSDYSNLSFGYVSSSGSYVPVYVFNYTSMGTVSSNNWELSDSFVSFTLPVDTEYLVFSCIPSSSSVGVLSGFSVSNCNFSYKVFNNQILIDNAYNTGYNAGSTAGYNNAYNQGYTAGLADGTNNDYSFLGLISSVIEAPVNVLIGEYDSTTGLRVGGLLNFEFLGYNMSTLLMSLFSLGVVICIIRLFI